MLSRHRLLGAATAAIITSVFAMPAFARDKEADLAKILLEKGIAQYKALDFRQAKATLLKVEAELLSDTGKMALNEHLGKVDTGIRDQAAAREALAAAREALKANKLTQAKQLFANAAASQYLPPALRREASKQAALISKKRQAVALAAKAQPKAALAPAAAPPPDEKPKAPEKDQAARILDAMAARQAKARELLAAGKAALDEDKPAKAAGLFRQALALVPDLAEAKERIVFAEGLLGKDQEAPVLTRLAQRRRVERQRANMRIDEALGNSNEILARAKRPEDFQASANAAQVAMDVLVAKKDLYTAKSYRDKRAKIEDQLKYVATEKKKWELEHLKKQREEELRIKLERIVRLQREKQLKISTLTARAKALKAGRRFEQALEEIERILALEPKDRWAADQKETLAQFIILMSEKDVVKTRNIETQKALIDVKRSEIPWWKELTYPRDWREITNRRAKFGVTAGLETELDRRVRDRLKEPIRELNFDAIELEAVIQFLRDVSGVNIYVKWGALSAAGITKSTPVNVHLQEVSLEKALQVILEDVGAAAPLGYVVDSGVISISTKDDLATKTITRVYDIRDLIVRIPQFIGPRLSTETAGEGGIDSEGLGVDTGGGVQLEGDEERGISGEEEEITREELIENIVEMFKKTIAPDSWQNVNEVGINEMHGQLVITQTAENHEKIVDLLGQLREARAIQVSIEARFIEIETGFLERIGFEMALTWSRARRLRASGGVDPLAIGGATMAGVNALGELVDWAHTVGGSGVGLDIAGAESLTPTALNISGAFMSDIQVDFLIQATQAHAMSRLLTAPRITLFNGQRAYVAVTRQQTYVSEFELSTSNVEETVAGLRQEITIETEVMYTGTMLDVEATISDDRRYVTLTLRPQVATGELTEFVIEGGTAGAGTEFETTMTLPDMTVNEVKTSVSVPDGGTILLGGLKRAGESEREIGVPLVNKVPILNRLFTNRGIARDDETLLILVTPKIIIQREEEELAFP